jgi:hypothetical protein
VLEAKFELLFATCYNSQQNGEQAFYPPLMRLWQFWCQTFRLALQSSPPRSVEVVMLSLAVVLFGVWTLQEQWPYLWLGSSYALGSATSIWVRETFFPSNQVRRWQATLVLGLSILLLLFAMYSFM